MKQHLYEPTLFLRDGKEWIKGFTMDRPSLKDFKEDEGLKFSVALSKFLASAVEYPVCEGSLIEIERFAFFQARVCGSFDSDKMAGIRIDGLADRLEVFTEYDFDGITELSKVIRLRPEVKEESQDEMIKEIRGIFGQRMKSKQHQDEILKSKFTIKRNP